jgi:hypothetical protein
VTCNPYETAGMTYDQATEALQHAAANPADQGRLIRLRQYDGDAPYAAADYGFLTSPTLGSGDSSLINSVAVVRPPACLLQRGVNVRPGVVQSVREAFNVRFDIYEGSMSDKYERIDAMIDRAVKRLMQAKAMKEILHRASVNGGGRSTQKDPKQQVQRSTKVV